MMGGGGAQRQQRAAEQAESQRRAQIAQTQQQVQAIYDTPERRRQYDELTGATRDFLTTDLDRKNRQTQRQAKFALARGGLSGGSADVDTNRAISEDYLRGALEVERRAQGAGAGLRQADQQAKLNLFGLAQSGVDATTLARQAGQGMQADIASQRASALQQGVGDVFGQFGDIYKESRQAKIRREQDKQIGGTFAQGPWSNWAQTAGYG
jgi:hypothetical protein